MPNTPIIRPVERADAPGCGRIIFESFATVADGHGFDRDFPSAEAATGFVDMLLATSTVRGFLAESDDRIVGCNFIDLAEPVAGVGPLAIDPAVQSNGLGRTLMEGAIGEATASGFESIRFMQSAYNNVSMALYTKLGFRVCATAAVMGRQA